jgi:NADH-quinone oxidoreductase subunit I
MWGKGLIKGLAVTWKHLWGRKETVYYPEEKLPMSERFRGGHLKLDTSKCIACQLCAINCPNRALRLTVQTDENKKRHMVSYVHDIGRCIYCNLCVESCRMKGLSWDKNYELATYFKDDLTYDAVQEAEERGKRHE